MKLNRELFLTGLMQVILVGLNTYQIAIYAKTLQPEILIGICVVGFLISFLWTYNVKKVAFGNMANRIWYSLGAATGSIVGVVVGSLIY